MPVVDFQIPDYFTRIVTWKVSETNEELLTKLKLTKARQERYASLTPKRKREYLGLRACLMALGLDDNIKYTPEGKPFVEGTYNISVSHSHGMVCVGASELSIGVDIELIRNHKIEMIKDKFIRKDEAEFIAKYPEQKIEYHHIIWSLKEALYKIHQGNLWSFRNHYLVEPFELKEEKPIICWVLEGIYKIKYYAHYKKINNYYMVYVLNYE